MPAKSPTILLIHGLWLTPLAWEHWIDHYESLGHEVLAPAWPRMDVGADALRADPSVMDGLGIDEVVDHYQTLIEDLDSDPILMGHSLGGAVTQILLDRGLGSAGVAIHSAPVKGVFRIPWSTLKATFPVLKSPATRTRTVALTADEFHYGFANTFSAEASRKYYDRYHVPTPGRPLWQVATANLRFDPPTRVDFRNHTRAPLLLIGGGADHTVPLSVTRETFKRYRKSEAVTALEEFPERSHFTLGEAGWEAVADLAIEWAREQGDAHAQQAVPVSKEA